MKDEAINICERKLSKKPMDHIYFGTCYGCYYHTGRCDLRLFEYSDCESYREDIYFTNFVHEKILQDPVWCKHNWEKLCSVDKELYLSIY